MLDRNEKGQFVKGSKIGMATEFKKGHPPFNKGIKQSRWCSSAGINASVKTRFKKGQESSQAKPLGYVSCFAHKRKGRATNYEWFINIDWKGNRCSHYPYRKYLWETSYGEQAPDGVVFIAKNGIQTEKPTLENIEMITRAELIKRNNPKSRM